MHVDLASDWSYVGFVSDSWTARTSPIGRSSHSWGLASNGAVYVAREEACRLQEFEQGGCITFEVDMDTRKATVTIGGKAFRDVFSNFPAPIFPAASNCRS